MFIYDIVSFVSLIQRGVHVLGLLHEVRFTSVTYATGFYIADMIHMLTFPLHYFQGVSLDWKCDGMQVVCPDQFATTQCKVRKVRLGEISMVIPVS